MANPDLVFVFMDRLPTLRDCIACIISYSPKHKQNYAIHKFVTALQIQWQKAFTAEHIVKFISPIKKKLHKELQTYTNRVLKKAKHERRKNQQKWSDKFGGSELFDILSPTSNPDLFDHDEKISIMTRRAHERWL